MEKGTNFPALRQFVAFESSCSAPPIPDGRSPSQFPSSARPPFPSIWIPHNTCSRLARPHRPLTARGVLAVRASSRPAWVGLDTDFLINNARRRRHRAAVQTQKGRNLARETPAHTASRAARRVETARRGQPRSYADGRERSTRVAGGYLGGTGGGRANGKDDDSEIHKRGRQCNSRGQRERKLQNVAQVQITSENNNRGKNHNHNQSCSREGRQRRGRGS